MESWKEELYHHGIKGQRWGTRRYQNKDGSLTDAGRIHYYGPNGISTDSGSHGRDRGANGDGGAVVVGRRSGGSAVADSEKANGERRPGALQKKKALYEARSTIAKDPRVAWKDSSNLGDRIGRYANRKYEGKTVTNVWKKDYYKTVKARDYRPAINLREYGKDDVYEDESRYTASNVRKTGLSQVPDSRGANNSGVTKKAKTNAMATDRRTALETIAKKLSSVGNKNVSGVSSENMSKTISKVISAASHADTMSSEDYANSVSIGKSLFDKIFK